LERWHPAADNQLDQLQKAANEQDEREGQQAEKKWRQDFGNKIAD
jgi:hypothetical protein